MSSQTHDHPAKDTDQARSHRDRAPARTPQTQHAPPAAAIRQAIASPQALAPQHLLALHPVVGNAAIQRVVGGPVIQRHFSEAQVDQAEAALADSMIAAHNASTQVVSHTGTTTGNTVTITGTWR